MTKERNEIADAMDATESLTSAERGALTTIVRQLGAEPFVWSKLEAHCPASMTVAHLKAGLVGLLRRGRVQAYRKAWGEPIYMIPPASYPAAHGFALPGPASWAEPTMVIAPEGGHRPGLSFHLLQLLSFAARSELPLKKDGTLAKRLVQKAAAPFSRCDEALQGIDWAYAHRDVYPPTLAVVLDMAMRLGLLTAEGERLTLDVRRLSAWLTLSSEQMESRLYRLWLASCLPTSLPLQHIAMGLERVPVGRWVAVGDVAAWVQAVTGGSAACSEDEAVQRWLRPLEAFGWIDLGRIPDADGFAFRWTISPTAGGLSESPVAKAEGEGFFVQPDFEILVPPGVPHAVLWELLCLAELVRYDVASVFRIRKETVLYALEQGRTCEGMLAFLERHAQYGVPDNVVTQVREWGKQFGKMALTDAVLLACADDATADAVAGQPSLAAHIQRRLGPTDFLIFVERVEAFAEALERSGFIPKRLDTTGTGFAKSGYPTVSAATAADDLQSVEGQGLIYANISEPLFDPDPAVPPWEDVFPNLKDVPAMWFKGLRAYHASTRKEIIRQAIEWKTALRLRREGGESLFAPTHLVEGRFDWTVMGRENEREVTLRPEEWEEMQLILPGINDNN